MWSVTDHGQWLVLHYGQSARKDLVAILQYLVNPTIVCFVVGFLQNLILILATERSLNLCSTPPVSCPRRLECPVSTLVLSNFCILFQEPDFSLQFFSHVD
ncbi:hypothetical protein BsWGS_00337 [Bradybaena similaris]